MITAPLPFEEAIRFLLDKEDLPAEWNSADWREHEADFRTQAFWVSRVENARFVDRAHGLLFDYMAKVREEITQPDGTKVTALKVSGREQFVKLMRDFMIAEGMSDVSEFKDVNQKDVEDIRSMSRLRLIFDTNVRQSYGFGQWKQGTTPAVLKDFPAARLIRERGVKEPRPRHQSSLGTVKSKLDPWWADYINDPLIGGFGVPWGPYGYNSGVNQEDVSREEANQLGVPLPSAEPVKVDPNSKLGASVKKMDPAIKAKLLEELRGGPKPKDPAEAAREAAANTRRIMLQRGMDEAIRKGDYNLEQRYQKAFAELPERGLRVVDDGDRIRLGE